MTNDPMEATTDLRSFRQLTAWQVGMALTIDVYRACSALPVAERFDLGRQLRRAAISVPSNIAEGFNRHSRAAYRSHVAIALGSIGELDTQVELANRLEYIDAATCRALFTTIDRTSRLLQGLWRSLE